MGWKLGKEEKILMSHTKAGVGTPSYLLASVVTKESEYYNDYYLLVSRLILVPKAQFGSSYEKFVSI